MGYKKASGVLPKVLLLAVQQYIDGEYIYIPRKDENRKRWGECSAGRCLLEKRNCAIWDQYQCGISVEALAGQYYLSPKTIYKILSSLKNKA